MGVLRILGPTGDVAVEWDATDVDDVREMRERFDSIVADGYLVYELDEQTFEGRQVKTFDPLAKRLRAFRPLQGG